MPEETTGHDKNEAGECLNPPLDFLVAIKELRERVDSLVLQARQRAALAVQTNDLIHQRDREQEKFNAFLDQPAAGDEAALSLRNERLSAFRHEIGALDQTIDELSGRLQSPASVLRDFLADVREVLSYLPSNRPRFKDIRAEIERLRLLTEVAPGRESPHTFDHSWTSLYGSATPSPGPLPIESELQKLKHRLGEFLEEERTSLSEMSAERRARRRRIVDKLRRKLTCKNHEALATSLGIHDSAIRAATRGSATHSGPTAAEKILNACRKHNVDASGW